MHDSGVFKFSSTISVSVVQWSSDQEILGSNPLVKMLKTTFCAIHLIGQGFLNGLTLYEFHEQI